VRKIGGIVVVGPFLFSQTRSQGYAHTLSLFLSKEEQVEEEDDDDDNDVDDGRCYRYLSIYLSIYQYQ
jgi:hypothetical protein